MKKSVSILLFVVTMLCAGEREDILSFITSSLSPANYAYFGVSNQVDEDRLELGETVKVIDVHNDSLKAYPNSSIGTKSSTDFRVVTLDGVPQFMVLVDAQQGTVSIGYRQLALELTKMVNRFDVNASDVTIYRATQINSFLFSIPTSKSRSANLTVLRPNWDKERTLLADFDVTVSNLKAGLEQ